MNPARPGRLAGLLVLVMMVMSALPTPAWASDDGELEMPGSWAEFTAYLVDGGDLGTLFVFWGPCP